MCSGLAGPTLRPMWWNFGLAAVLLLVAAKCVAYFWEMCWFALRGTQKLLPAYECDRERTYEKDQIVGRPRLFSRRAERADASTGWRIWAVIFKTPTVVLVLFAGTAGTAAHAAPVLLICTAVLASVFGVAILLVPVVMRLVLGPYDVLNPDLQLPGFVARRMYEGRSNSLGLYALVLIALTILSFGSAYEALGSIPGVLLPSSASSDPVKWLYSAINISATEGLGDVTLTSDGVRAVVAAQMTLGPLALAWVVSSFFSERIRERPTDQSSHGGTSSGPSS